MDKKKKGMTREEAFELYDDLQKAMGTLMAKKGRDLKEEISKVRGQGAPPEAPQAKSAPVPPSYRFRAAERGAPPKAAKMALGVIVLLMAGRLGVTSMEFSGLLDAQVAEASIPVARTAMGQFSKEEITILTSLDQRRAELEKKSREIEERRLELDRRDSEFAVKLTELRDLSSRLRGEREKDEKKRNTQIEQLANVYGSMNPPEAAQLIEQLDVNIALELIGKMPEKRIGQILALMSPERALAITRMLSGRKD